MMNNENELKGIFGMRPVLCVDNVSQSIDYYVNKIGFRRGFAWDDTKQKFLEADEKGDIGFASVFYSGDIQLMLCQQGQGQPGMWIHLDVDSVANLDALHAHWIASGVNIVEPPSIRPWGMYEMRIEDLDGHTFRVSSPAENK